MASLLLDSHKTFKKIRSKFDLKNRIPGTNYIDLISFSVAYSLLLLTSKIPFIGWMISLLCIFYKGVS